MLAENKKTSPKVICSSRRSVLAALAALPLMAARPLRAAAKGVRVVVVGGGWGGLAAAAELLRLAPEIELSLIEPRATFFSLPLSNALLAGRVDAARLQRSQAAAATRHGYRWVSARVTWIDRQRQEVLTTEGNYRYDWLILASGIRHDYRSWLGDDDEMAMRCVDLYGAAFDHGEQVVSLKQRLDRFSGGDFLMTIPPGPYRCPPAPYERAVAIASQFRQRKLAAKVVLLDPGSGMAAFRQVFAERYADIVQVVPHTAVTGVDLDRKRVLTEFDEFRFDDAILMPPQQASALVWQAGLIDSDSQGQPTGWGAVDPLRLHAKADERVFLVGDAVGAVSPLFGHYPKTAHMAVSMGKIAAARIAEQINGLPITVPLPESLCHVTTDFQQPEGFQVSATYRQRGDGLIMQSVRQQRNPQPRGEDLAWLDGQLEGLF
jgi:NADPH-dependent 2,4-dienoyl-CoA reductase/sulfur reductase-like enzyme